MPAPVTNSPTPSVTDLPPGQYINEDGPFSSTTYIVNEMHQIIYTRTFDTNSRFETILEYLPDGTSRTIINLDQQFVYTNVFNDKGWIISRDDTGVGSHETWDYNAQGLITHTSFSQTEYATVPELQPATERSPAFFYTAKDAYFGPNEAPSFTLLKSDTETLRVSYDSAGAIKNLVHTYTDGEISKTVDQYDDAAGARIPYRHLEYDQSGTVVLEDRFDKAGTLTYETKTLDDGAHYAMSMAADGQHIQISETDGSIRLQETVRADGSLFVTKLGNLATVESTPHDDIFTSTNGGATFLFADGFGHDVIRNFHTDGANHDRIIIDTDREVNSWYYNGTDSIIIVGNVDYDTITLKGVHIDQLNQGDILIV